MKLNKVAFAFATGIMWGAIVFLATWWIVIRGGTGEIISRLGRFYIGYTPSPSGSILGLIYAFVNAFVGGDIFAALYNAFVAPTAEEPVGVAPQPERPAATESGEVPEFGEAPEPAPVTEIPEEDKQSDMPLEDRPESSPDRPEEKQY